MRGYTSIEQSKKLLELGLDPNTADAHWWTTHGTHIGLGWSDEFRKKTGGACHPAWSLAAMLELMPRYIEDIDDKLFFWSVWKCKNLKWLISYSSDYWDEVAAEISGKELIDAAVETVCWLLENKYIEPTNKE